MHSKFFKSWLHRPTDCSHFTETLMTPVRVIQISTDKSRSVRNAKVSPACFYCQAIFNLDLHFAIRNG